MAKGDDIQERLIRFGVTILNICEALPGTPMGLHKSGQMMRSGTSAAANYAEARGAESMRDLIHKLGLVLKELNETFVWLRMIAAKDLGESGIIQQALGECTELSKIIAVSRRTAARRAGRIPPDNEERRMKNEERRMKNEE